MENKFTPIEYTGSAQQEGSFSTDQDISQPIEYGVFDAQTFNKESEAPTTMTYKEWKKNGFEAEVGTIITNVRPASLYTPQDWLDPTKIGRTMDCQHEGTREDAFAVKGIVFKHPKPHMGKVPVILEGNTRAVNAEFNRDRITFEIIDKEINPNTLVWGVRNLFNKYGGILK